MNDSKAEETVEFIINILYFNTSTTKKNNPKRMKSSDLSCLPNNHRTLYNSPEYLRKPKTKDMTRHIANCNLSSKLIDMLFLHTTLLYICILCIVFCWNLKNMLLKIRFGRELKTDQISGNRKKDLLNKNQFKMFQNAPYH